MTRAKSIAVSFLAAIIFLAAQGSVPISAETCSDLVSKNIVLASQHIDPDVFVWAWRSLLVAYTKGMSMPPARPHSHLQAYLEPPGTRAIVLGCSPGLLQPLAGIAHDALRIRLLSGPDRNHGGWIDADDGHLLR